MLQDKSIPYARICCLRQIIGEKKSLKQLLEMARRGIALLSLPTREEAIMQCEKSSIKHAYYAYYEDILPKITWE